MADFSATLAVPADHPCLAGHFPGRPVVPAVLLLQLVQSALRQHLGEVVLEGVPTAKFLLPLVPEQEFGLVLQIDAARGRASFRCACRDGVAARGELSFRLAAAPPGLVC
jgi:3-hydroxyacyl-[acyl-carrier-protein] dehydratase